MVKRGVKMIQLDSWGLAGSRSVRTADGCYACVYMPESPLQPASVAVSEAMAAD